MTYDAVCSDAEQSFALPGADRGPRRRQPQLRRRRRGPQRLRHQPHRLRRAASARRRGRPSRHRRAHRRRIVESSFPELIDPACPFQDIRALTHEIAPGREGRRAAWRATRSRWRTTATGWTPPTRPTCGRWRSPGPTRSRRARRSRQRVAMTLHGRPPAAAAAGRRGRSRCRSAVSTGHTMPRVGLAVPAEHVDAALGQRGPAEGGRRRLPRLPLRSAQGARRGDHAGPWPARRRRSAPSWCSRPSFPASTPTASRAPIRRSCSATWRRSATPRRAIAFARVAVSPASDLKSHAARLGIPPGAGLGRADRGGARGLPGGGGRRRHVQLLHRAEPQAPAGRAARLHLPHRPADRARRRRHLAASRRWRRCRRSSSRCAPSPAASPTGSSRPRSPCATTPTARRRPRTRRTSARR